MNVTEIQLSGDINEITLKRIFDLSPLPVDNKRQPKKDLESDKA